MPINFPDAPSTGDTHTVGDKTWTYDGTAWNLVTSSGSDHGSLGGLEDDDHTQYLLADGTRTATEVTVSGDLTVDTDTLHVDSTNNRVGIGTTSPTTALDISQVNPTLTINDTDGVAGGSITSLIQFEASNTVAGEVGFATGAGNMISWANDGNYYAGTRSADNIFLRTNDTERLTIDSSGDVGIGTTTPDNKLHVQIGASAAPASVPTSHMIIADSGEATDSGMAVYSSTTGNGYIRFGDSDNAAQGGFRYEHSADKMYFRTGGTDRGAIDSSGNVGIGTTSPRGILDVRNTGDVYLVDNTSQQSADIYMPGHVFLVPFGSGDVSYLQARRGDTSGNAALYLRTTNGGTVLDSLQINNGGRIITPHQPAFVAYRSTAGNQSLSTGGDHVLQFNAVTGNRGGWYSTSTYRFTAPETGYYAFHLSARIDGISSSSGYYRWSIRKNGTNAWTAPNPHAIISADGVGTSYMSKSISGILYLSANDYVEPVFTNSGAGVSSGLQNESQFSGMFIG